MPTIEQKQELPNETVQKLNKAAPAINDVSSEATPSHSIAFCHVHFLLLSYYCWIQLRKTLEVVGRKVREITIF